MTDSFPTIAEAFSRTAAKYDAFAEGHPHLARLRGKVHDHLSRHAPPGGRILELNAGTGIDAAALARRGYRVHATDISPGMLARARQKVERLGLQEQVSVQECSFTELERVEGAPFEAVFSNLGGLNCIPDLTPVIAQLPSVLRPGGTVTWVLMPPVCLWELAEIFRGNFRLAFRRLTGQTRSHLEGLYFDVHYFPPRRVLGWFGVDGRTARRAHPDGFFSGSGSSRSSRFSQKARRDAPSTFKFLEMEGLSVITPTAESKALAKRAPRLYAALARLDDALSVRPPWWGWGDFYILTMRYLPE